MTPARDELAAIQTFPQLVRYLRDELDWPVTSEDFEDMVFDYSAEDLGIDAKSAAKIQEIKRLRPLSTNQPWGIFFVKFEPKRLPVVALRRILSGVALRKRASANSPDHAAWAVSDLLFISNYGEGEARQINFAHFSDDPGTGRLPTLRVLGWDNLDTPLHLEDVAETLARSLRWPDDEADGAGWHSRWENAFSLGYREVISTSREMAVRLAQLARIIRTRISSALTIETELGPLTQLMKSVRRALVHDLDPSGFADMYAQTIAYGLLSARISNPESERPADIAGHMRTNPLLRDLMQTFLLVGRNSRSVGGPEIDFDELGVTDVVELMHKRNMEAVLRDFGDRNPEEDPVIHFYELFLKEYDPEQRMQRGVFYTPRPIVSYIVQSVDALLRGKFGLADGLADTATWDDVVRRHPTIRVPQGVALTDPFVSVLDPATGTGTFLVEIIDVVHRTMMANWRRRGMNQQQIREEWNRYVATHLLPRLHGFELLMAPYAIAHLKVSLKLHETGYEFASDERARIFLTNTLDPASPLADTGAAGLFEALDRESEAVNTVKRHHRFTVIVGNPPYAGISANMTDSAQRLVDAYKFVDGESLAERKLWLQDDYVKFIRFAEQALFATSVGILGFITNHGYLDNPTFRGMRRSLMSTFSELQVLDLHGNGLKKERAPDGSDDRNVFEIRQGVAICVALRGSRDDSPGRFVARADLWGTTEAKLRWLASHESITTSWTLVTPTSPYYFFRDVDEKQDGYAEWMPLSRWMPVYSSGVITARDELVMDMEPTPILDRISLLRDEGVSDDALRRLLFDGKSSPKYPAGDSRGWKLPLARRKLRQDPEWQSRVSQCLYRPFDRRSVYMTEWMVDWSRPEIRRHLELNDNLLLVFPRNTGVGRPWDHAFISNVPILGRFFPDSACITYMAPMLVIGDGIFGSSAVEANASEPLQGDPAAEPAIRSAAADRLGYLYSILYSPGYRDRYASELRVDFPRVPVSPDSTLRVRLSSLGSQLISLHLLDFALPADHGFEYVGPRAPIVEKVSWDSGSVWLSDRPAIGTSDPDSGPRFRGVPQSVWDFSIGGYQPLPKWLRDRRGRELSPGDVTYYQKVAFAIKETIRLMGEIDSAIGEFGGWPGAFVIESA